MAIVAASPLPGLATAQEDSRGRGALEWMQEAYRRKALKDFFGAATAFRVARAKGFDPQRVDLELAYLALDRGDSSSARQQLETVASGPDGALAGQARAQLDLFPKRLRRDLYADGYGWRGVSGNTHVANTVPTLRLRAHYRPWLDHELSLYLYAQGTRDVASQGGALPKIYSDNYALVGPGVLLPLWNRRVGLFAQAGAAFNLVDDGRSRTAFDARGGAFTGLESSGCLPGGRVAVRLELRPCADLYAEAVWLSRFENDVVVFARGRAGTAWLVTGPVDWHLLLEARGAANRLAANGDDFVEGGVWHRWRLLRPLRLDALVGVNSGRTVEIAGKRPLRPGSYTELRFQLVTFLEF